MRRRGALAALVAVAAACSGERVPGGAADSITRQGTASLNPPPPEAPAVVLTDSGQAPAVLGGDGWNYSQSTTLDVDGDGQGERVVMMARVELIRGRPAWDDGQQWQVYVEEADSTRTTIYARFLQMGTLTMRVEGGGGSAPRRIVLLEQLPDQLSVYDVTYRGPDNTRAITAYQRQLDPTGEVAGPSLP
jgi:hypothetical protein